ncbi:uncharacterized protein LOC105691829 [Athalia rosae]|uniref:uncharacterized protein LOC105691829 n=1 Tax=Athalia rosae TaxID=37344 RepID=UPI0020345FE3|nr:uncharacterized protein LOC105691829 [Athalia rosae]
MMRISTWCRLLPCILSGLVPLDALPEASDHPGWSLLNHERCGVSNTDRIIGGRNASLGAYPWIARIGYASVDEDAGNATAKERHLEYKCGGTLINQFYVVTAAHCVINLPPKYRVAGIRLGEHNTETNPDCEGGYCGDPVQDVAPERVIVHKGYDNPRFSNDIALVRLSSPIRFNDLVGPICMIRGTLLGKNYVGETAEVAGWGIYDIHSQKTSKILQTVKLPLVDLERCKRAFRFRAQIGHEQLCGGGILGEDSCAGDSGGPVMKVEALDGPPRYYLIGVVSFGVMHCGESTTPAVYTKMSEYASWILENIEPFLLCVRFRFKMGHLNYNYFISLILRTALLLQVISPAVLSQRSYQRANDCQTPRNAPGYCVEISQCDELVQLLQARPLRNDAYDLLKQSHCGFQGKDPKVCCPSLGTSTRPRGDQANPGVVTDNSGPTNVGTWDLSSNRNLPSECGEDLTQRVVGGERTDLSEFPWMALLEYTKPNGRTTACGGVLISKRYVMTAAHCIKGKDLPKSWNLVGVRLGEYDTSTDRDCLPDGRDSVYCADDPVTVGIEEQIAHEDYKPQSRDQSNDIALLRLSRDVPFTSFIRPICLPPNSSTSSRFFFVAGWGKTETRSESNVKLKLKIPLAEPAQCSSVYQAASINLGSSQLCAGGERGRDSCRGDSGGPLMSVAMSNRGTLQWTAAGIVSFGPSPCGMQNWPGVYTRVSSFMPWILSKIRA